MAETSRSLLSVSPPFKHLFCPPLEEFLHQLVMPGCCSWGSVGHLLSLRALHKYPLSRQKEGVQGVVPLRLRGGDRKPSCSCLCFSRLCRHREKTDTPDCGKDTLPSQHKGEQARVHQHTHRRTHNNRHIPIHTCWHTHTLGCGKDTLPSQHKGEQAHVHQHTHRHTHTPAHT